MDAMQTKKQHISDDTPRSTLGIARLDPRDQSIRECEFGKAHLRVADNTIHKCALAINL